MAALIDLKIQLSKTDRTLLKFFVIFFNLKVGATVPIFKTQLRRVFPGIPIYFTDFIFCMVISYYHIRMGI